MKKIILKVFGIIILLIIVVATCIFVWQKDNVIALVNSVLYTQDEINTKLADNEKQIENALGNGSIEGIRPFTDEEKQQIASGKITAKDVFTKILNEPSDLSSQDASNKDSKNGQKVFSNEETVSAPTAEKTSASMIKDCVSGLSQLEAEFSSKLDGIIGQAISDYEALPKDQHTSYEKQAALSKYIGQISSIESSCDSKVEDLLSTLESNLKSIGADTQIVKTLRSTYNQEKNLKKSYYINKYK